MTRLFTFIGITTGQSSIMQIFPRWRDLLGLGADVEIVGRDLPIHAPPEQYRRVVEALRDDPSTIGGLVTTHKIDLYHAAKDLFDEVDEYAELLDEVSCMARRDGWLRAWATDSIAAGRTMDESLGAGYFGRTGAHTLCFGAGGAARAIILHLLTRAMAMDRPARIIVTDPSARRLESLRALQRRLLPDASAEYVESGDPAANDTLLTHLPPGSLVINATGMGKDTPGSPLSDAACFPERGIAWELNYRGELTFLHQAESQPASGNVRVQDGWRYFIFGWTAVMEKVFARTISPEELRGLTQAAAFARPPGTASGTR
ncbi:MAG: shikimate dehydrogenase family protein [Chloroflexota bacterium]|nr:MAG: shikimate dehydrogenase [Chloroflexota bacterium]